MSIAKKQEIIFFFNPDLVCQISACNSRSCVDCISIPKYYVYDGDWNDLQTEATFGTITLDFTNASTTTACGSNPRQWFFSSVSRAQATETVWDDCANGGSGYVEGSVSNINTSGYAFNINF